jgi:hypothetical protein
MNQNRMYEIKAQRNFRKENKEESIKGRDYLTTV